MKFNIEVDCTPEEARTFLGLPDVKPMQDRMMQQIEEQMQANLKAMDAETLMKTWLPAGMQSWEQMQKAFWGSFAQGGKSAAKSAAKSRGEGKDDA